MALAVLALGLGAAIKATADSVENLTLLRDRTLAGWVASNQLNAALLTPQWADLGRSQGQTEMAGGRWLWRA